MGFASDAAVMPAANCCFLPGKDMEKHTFSLGMLPCKYQFEMALQGGHFFGDGGNMFISDGSSHSWKE